jgi:hypothetical protein
MCTRYPENMIDRVIVHPNTHELNLDDDGIVNLIHIIDFQNVNVAV